MVESKDVIELDSGSERESDIEILDQEEEVAIDEEDEEDVGDEEEEETGDEEEVGDAEYQLKRPEGQPLSPAEWKKRCQKASSTDKLVKQLLEIKPFCRNETNGRVVATTSFNNVLEGICLYLNGGSVIDQKVLTSQVQEVFSRCDILYGITRILAKSMKDFTQDSTWLNVFGFLKLASHPSQKIVPRLFKQKYHYLKSKPKTKLMGAYESMWFALMTCKIPKKVLVKVVQHVSANVLSNLRQPHKTADFFFRTFDLGSVFSVLSLDAIFRLIVEHNFEYPNFYEKVYSLCIPSLLYTEHKQKFLELLDKFLTSSHVPLYTIAGFCKRLARMLLVAPLDAQEPVLGLVRNLITRHPALTQLIHREIPKSCQGDPYLEDETLAKCNALDSSLWELKTLKRHWHQNVQKRAAFVDKAFQKTESFVRFRCQDEYFSVMMNKRFGSETDDAQEKYTKSQDGSDDEEPAAKKAKLGSTKKGKFAKKHEAEKEHTIPINFTAHNGKFMPENAFNYEYSDFWTV